MSPIQAIQDIESALLAAEPILGLAGRADLERLAELLTRLAGTVATVIASKPTGDEVVQQEIDAADVAAEIAEDKKFGAKP